MLSTGEASISNMADEKAGVSARVVTLQDQPYPDNFDFTTLDKAFRKLRNIRRSIHQAI